jgi:hypothetical protein
MPINVEKAVDGFPPHTTIAPITCIPNYKFISTFNLQLNLNSSSVQSNVDDGLLGQLYIIIMTTKYTTLSATEFILPEKPVAAQLVPYAARDSQTAILI